MGFRILLEIGNLVTMFPDQLIIVFQLFLALLLGGIIGVEREILGKAAGLRTYALVSMGAALFTVISRLAFDPYIGITNFDPSRIPAQIIVGIGFLGAGLIFHHGLRVEGLTTAAGLWVASGIGMAVGTGLYFVAAAASLLTLFVFAILGRVELRKRSNNGDDDGNN